MKVVSYKNRFKECLSDGTSEQREIKGSIYFDGKCMGFWCNKHDTQCMSSVCREERGIKIEKPVPGINE